ncbi:Gfo/Idh/MocA family oxidoreductase [Methylotenera sp.]|uniref:Gfo/Idh/MocA family protein n=1 Tax=Methylotenera sp. TaxID=2051956 RepID=UPI002EDB1542
MTFESIEPLRVGFVGGALNSAVGYTHFNASRLDGHFRVEAGCFSRNTKHNELTAQTYGVAANRIYDNWQQLFDAEKSNLDAIVILTPTPSHAEIAVAALEAGYPVICEKALGTSSEECLLIDAAVSKNNGYLAVTYNYSGYPMVRELQTMISEGRFGKIQQIHIEMPQEGFLRLGANPQDWRRSDALVPTVSLDLGVHIHHLVDFLTGGNKPQKVVGDQSSYGQFNGLVDNVYCLAQYQDELRVQAWWGKTALGQRNGLRIRVFGSIASAEWYQMQPEDLRWADNDGHYYVLDRGSSEAKTAQEPRYNRFKAGHPSGFIEAFANLYADIADDLRSFKKNKTRSNKYVHGTVVAAEGIRFLEKVSESAQIGSWINI